MAQLREHYDWIVFGDHPAGLLTAGLMARLGLSVLVLPIQKPFLASVSSSGQCLDPESNFVPGVRGLDKEPGILTQALRSVGGTSALEGLIQDEEEGPYQVVTPHHRILIKPDMDAALREVEISLGRTALDRLGFAGAARFYEPEVHRAWSSLLSVRPEAGKKPKRNPPLILDLLSKRLLDKSFQTPTRCRNWFSRRYRLGDVGGWEGAEEFFLGLKGLLSLGHSAPTSHTGASVGHEDIFNPKLLDFLNAFHVLRGGARYKGGLTAFRTELLEMAKKAGAQVPENVECRRLFVERDRLIGVQISYRGKVLSLDGGIWGGSLEHAKPYLCLSDGGQAPTLKKAQPPYGWKFTLAVTVNSEALIPGMGPRWVWKERGAPVLEVEVADPTEYEHGFGKKNERLLFLRTVLPFSEESLKIETQRTVAARMFHKVKELIPFLEFHVVRIFPDFRDSSKMNEFDEAYFFHELDQIPDNLRVVSGKPVGFHSGLHGLYVASEESYPSLGSFGATVSAFESITHFFETKGPRPGQRNIGNPKPKTKSRSSARPS